MLISVFNIFKKLKVCIIVPCYNEENRLNQNIFVKFLNLHKNYHICFVNDGSSDNTFRVIQNLSSQHSSISFIDNKINQGKAETVRIGFLHNLDKYDALAFLDADLATPLEEIIRMTNFIELNNYNVIIGSRILKLGSNIRRRFKRHLFGRLFASLTDKLFQINAYDTQCGAKIFKNEIAALIFKEPFQSKWIFDVELLIRIRQLNLLHTVYEFPIKKWIDVKGSKIKFKDIIQLPLEILRLYKYYK